MEFQSNMMLIRHALRTVPRAWFGRLGAWLTVLTAVLPLQAFAAGGENVELVFSAQDRMYLYASLGFGVVAIIAALMISSSVKKQSPGSQKMQDVGQAIREGALAYL